MICGKCGEQNSNNRAYCKSCGQSLWPTLKPKVPTVPTAVAGHSSPLTSTISANVPTVPIPPITLSVDFSELYGVRGWLLLFCIVITILNPLVAIAGATRSEPFPAMAFELGIAALCVRTGVAVWRKAENALRSLKVYFLVLLSIATLGLLASIILKQPYLKRDLSTDPGQEACLQTVAFVLFWWAYFKKSRRVKATFGRNL